jgi:flagellar biosynthesis anti-sigma factor FlgM
MRIDRNHGSQPLPQTESSTTASTIESSTDRSDTRRPLAGEDQPEPSGIHSQVKALVAQAVQLPEVRQERVYALRQTIQSGVYHSGPEEVAKAMFEHMIAGSAA